MRRKGLSRTLVDLEGPTIRAWYQSVPVTKQQDQQCALMLSTKLKTRVTKHHVQRARLELGIRDHEHPHKGTARNGTKPGHGLREPDLYPQPEPCSLPDGQAVDRGALESWLERLLPAVIDQRITPQRAVEVARTFACA